MSPTLADAAPPPEALILVCGCPAAVAFLLTAGVVSLGLWLARRRTAKPNDTTERTE